MKTKEMRYSMLGFRNNDKSAAIISIILLITGIVCFCVGKFGLQSLQLEKASFVLVGGGAVSFLCFFISKKVMDIIYNKKPFLQKQIKIDETDERNILISNKAKAKAYDVTSYAFCMVTLIYVLVLTINGNIGITFLILIPLIIAFVISIIANIY